MKAAGVETVDVGDFYRHMSDIGLRYGEEFRPIRELAAGGGKSTGRVSLSEAVSRRVERVFAAPGHFWMERCKFSPRARRQWRIVKRG